MGVKIVSNESIPAFEAKVNELLSQGYKIRTCGAHESAFWAILEKSE